MLRGLSAPAPLPVARGGVHGASAPSRAPSPERVRELLIVSPSAFQPFGHQQSYVTGLGSALEREGVRVHVVGWEGPVTYPQSLAVHHVPRRKALGRRSDLRRRFGPAGDVVWGVARVLGEVGFGRTVARIHRGLGGPPLLFETFEYVSLCALLKSGLLGHAPRLSIFHDTNFNTQHASPIAALYKRAVRPFAASILARSDVVLVHAEGMRENLLHNLDPHRRWTNKVRVLPYGAPHPDSVERVERADARRRLGLPQDARIALAFGTLRSDKCLEATLEGVARASGWILLVAGPEGDVSYTELRKLAARTTLGDRLRLHEGFVPREMHATVFAGADVVVNLYAPSVRHESGTAQLARSYLRPTIVGGPPDLSRYVAETGTGWVVDASDPAALARALDDVARLPAESIRKVERDIYTAAVERSWERVSRIVLDAVSGLQRPGSADALATDPDGK